MKPAPQILTGRDVPLVRAELVAWLDDPGPDGGPVTWSQGFAPEDADRERRNAGTWATSLRAAELFYVAADMARLAVAAGQALPAYRLHPEEVPSPHGLLLWEEPITDDVPGGETTNAPVIAVTWAVRGSGVRVRTWARREDWLASMAQGDPRAGIRDLTPDEVRAVRARNPQPIVALGESNLPFGVLPGWLANAPEHPEDLSWYELEDHARRESWLEQAERATVVTWLLMGQTLTSRQDVDPPKSGAKFIRRIDPGLLATTRYVQLRHHAHIPQARDESGARTGRDYRHQWIVRGHWRNQFFPSRKTNRPIWIADHPKGPAGAPFLDPDKLVNVLRQ